MSEPPTASEIAHLLKRGSDGDPRATEELLPLVYEELKQQAAKHMAGERANHTLQATVLVHDAYLGLVGASGRIDWASAAHFYATASRAMRRLLVDHARARSTEKRGGDRLRVELSDFRQPDSNGGISSEELIELDDTLEKLEGHDPQVAELVRVRLYAGLSVTEAAKTLGISRSTAYERWDYATSWFKVEMADS